jgi:tetratricopeptide (TPR) repeat protein
MAVEDAPAARRLQPWLAAGIALVALSLFVPALGSHGLIDGPDSILRLPLVSHVKHVPQIFSQDFLGFTNARYQPLPYALLATVRTVVPVDAVWFWHAWLLGFCVLNAFLVYAIARHFARRAEAALLAFALFLLHPMSSAFGNQINLFPLVLAGTFYLGSFVCYLKCAKQGGVAVYLLGLGLFVCGLLSSQVLLTLPVLILLYELFYKRTRLSRALDPVLPFAAAVLLACYFYLSFHPHPIFYINPPNALPGPVENWMFSFAAGGVDTFFGLLRGLSTPAPVGGLRGVWALGGVGAVLLAGFALTAWGLRRRQWTAVGAFLLWFSMIPRFGMPENLTPDLDSWSYAYLPLAGFALLIGELVDTLLVRGRERLRQPIIVMAAGGVLACAWLLAVANVQARGPESWWRHALKENPRNQIASVALGKIYLAEGDEKQALTYLFSPYTDRVREGCLAMARYYGRRGDWNAAAVHLLIAAREEPWGLLEQEDKLTRAEVLREAGAYDYAEQDLGNVLMADPCNTTALKRLSELLGTKGYVPAAVECLEAAADIDPGDGEAARMLKAMEDRLHEPEKRDAPTKVIPPDPGWLRYVTDQGGSWYMAEASGVADLHPSDPIVQMVAGISLSESGDYKRALVRIDRAIEMLPLYTRPRAAKCWVAASMGDRPLALATVEGVTHVKPWDRGIWHQIGNGIWSKGDVETAIACHRKAIEANPNVAELQNDMGALLLMEERAEEALPYFRKALTLPGGDRAAIHNGTGFALMSLGRRDEALAHFRKAVELDPWYVLPYRNMAKLYGKDGRFADSVRVLSEGVRRVPNDTMLPLELAALLAMGPEASARDGERAVRLAEAVCRRADPVTPQQLDVLAAAYAENAQFDKAVDTARRAIELARRAGQLDFARAVSERCRLYERRQPYHISLPAPKKP